MKMPFLAVDVQHPALLVSRAGWKEKILCTCGFFLGRPRPLFSETSFSCFEARGWLDFALDSLIFLSSGSCKREDRRVSQPHFLCDMDIMLSL